MYNHAPEGYVCPFCRIAVGLENEGWNYQADVFYQNEFVTAFIAPLWWPNNAGHAIVIPHRHIENIYDLTPDIAVHVHETARQVSIAIMRLYDCEGTSIRQHNGTYPLQEVWHYHLHVFPRYIDDQLYGLERHTTTPEERRPYADKLRTYFQTQSE